MPKGGGKGRYTRIHVYVEQTLGNINPLISPVSSKGKHLSGFTYAEKSAAEYQKALDRGITKDRYGRGSGNNPFIAEKGV